MKKNILLLLLSFPLMNMPVSLPDYVTKFNTKKIIEKLPSNKLIKQKYIGGITGKSKI